MPNSRGCTARRGNRHGQFVRKDLDHWSESSWLGRFANLNDLRDDLLVIEADQAVFNSSNNSIPVSSPRSACETLHFQAVEMMESIFRKTGFQSSTFWARFGEAIKTGGSPDRRGSSRVGIDRPEIRSTVSTILRTETPLPVPRFSRALGPSAP